MQILDISKILVYKFLYDYLVPTYGSDKINVIYTDTDSLIVKI